MVDVNEIYGDKDYLKASDLGNQSWTYIMGAVEPIKYDDGTKLLIHFQDTDKKFVANKTNAEMIKAMFGPETDHWFGRRLTIFPTTTPFQGNMVPCIRVQQEFQQAVQQAEGTVEQQMGIAQQGHPITNPQSPLDPIHPNPTAPNAPGQEQTGDPGVGQKR